MYSQNDWRSYKAYELYHHGIMGQKWGRRQGPPYPLGASDHSSSEKKAGWKDSIGKSDKGFVNKHSDRNLADAHQKYGLMADLAAIGIVTAGAVTVSAVQTGVRAHKNKKEDALGYDIRAKKRAESGEKIDPATGLYKKDKPTSREEDIKAVNPDFKLGGYGATNNCFLCTTAYDMRRRGYDVEAKKMNGDGVESRALKSLYKNPVINKISDKDPVTGKRSSNVNVNRQNMINNAKKEITAQGDSRGNIMVMWSTAGGHSMAYEVKHGALEILDTQCGRVYKGSEVDRLLSRTKDIQYARLDNLEIKEKAMKRMVR